MPFGAISGRPTYDQLCEASHGKRRSYLALRPAFAVEEWANFVGNTFVAQFDKPYRNLRRDVVGVLVLDRPPLTRAETLASCITTSMSYFYDVDEEFAFPLFVWDDSYWDIGILGGVDPTDSRYWDQFAQLYVNLGGLNPASLSVQAVLGFYASQEGLVESSLGDDLFAGTGSFETWS